MSPILTTSLVVTASAQESLVWYTIHRSKEDKTELKTVRLSELKEMHKVLLKEVPTFPGRLPPRTLMQSTKPNFIETRRKTIEIYLRLASMDQMAQASGAWHQFFGGLASTHSSMQNNAADYDVSEDETEPESFSSTQCEVRSRIQSKQSNLTVAQERMQSLEGDLKTILDSVLSAEAEAKDKVAAENEAAARLRTHRESLAELDMQFSVQSMMNKSSERQQSEMAKRLLEDLQKGLQLATSSKNKAQQSFEIAREAVADASTKAHANVAAARAAKAEAEATHADALAMSVLQIRAQDRLDAVSIAERELENLKSAHKVFDAEKKEAADLSQKGEVETKAAVRAVASHIEKSACRSRAHKLEIKRARERLTNSATLRDMRSRGLLMGVDCSSLEPAENASNAAAEAAAEVLAKATQAADETKSADQSQLEALQAVAALANKKLWKREIVMASFAARSMANKVAMEDASAKLAAAAAVLPNNAIQQMFVTLWQQVETLAQALPECSAKLAEATKAVATVTEAQESELHLLRQAEQVESQVLKDRQAKEAALVKALGEALGESQIAAAAEAAGAVEPSMEEGPDFNQLVTSSEAHFLHLDKAAQVAAHGYKTAFEAGEVVKCEFAAIGSADDDADEDVNGDSDSEPQWVSTAMKERDATKRKIDKERDAAKRKRKIVSLSSKIEALEPVIQDKKNVLEAAVVAANAAKKELDALRAQQKTTFCPAEVMVKQEINLVDSCLASRKHHEAAIMGEVQQQVAALMVEQEALGADIHRVKLLAAAAEADVTTNKNLAKSLAKSKKI